MTGLLLESLRLYLGDVWCSCLSHELDRSTWEHCMASEVIDRGLCWLERLATGPAADTGDLVETLINLQLKSVEPTVSIRRSAALHRADEGF